MAAASVIRTIGVRFDPKPTEEGVRQANASLGTMATAARRSGQNMASESRRARGSIVTAFAGIAKSIAHAFTTKPVVAFFAAIRSGAAAAGNQLKGLLGILKNPVFLGVTGLGAVIGVSASISASEELRKVQNTLKAVSDDAESDLAFLRMESDRLGLSFIEAAKGFSKFTAAGKNSGLTAMELKNVFLGVAEAGAVFGLNAEEQRGAMKALEQMLSKGNVSAEELRQQLGERLPGAFSLAAKAMGVTTSQLNDMLDKGEVLAVDLLPRLASEMREVAASGLDASLRTFTKETQRFSNAFFEARAQFGEPVAQALAPIVADATARLEQRVGEGDFTRFGETLAQGIELGMDALKNFRELLQPIANIMMELVNLTIHAAKGVWEWVKALTASQIFKDVLQALKDGLIAVSNVLVGFGKKLRENVEPATFVAIGVALGAIFSFLVGNQSLMVAFVFLGNAVVLAFELLFSVLKTIGLGGALKIAGITAAVILFKDAILVAIDWVKALWEAIKSAGAALGIWDNVKRITEDVSLALGNVAAMFTDVRVVGVTVMDVIGGAIALVVKIVLKLIEALSLLAVWVTNKGLESFKAWAKEATTDIKSLVQSIRDLMASLDGTTNRISSLYGAMNKFIAITPAGFFMDLADGIGDAGEATEDTATATGKLVKITGGALTSAMAKAAAATALNVSGVSAFGIVGTKAMEGVENSTDGVSSSLERLSAEFANLLAKAGQLKTAFHANPDLGAAFFNQGEGIADTALARKNLGIDRLRSALPPKPGPPPARPGKDKKKKAGGGGRKGRVNRGPSDADLRHLLEGGFKMESFAANLARIEEGMLGAFNTQILKDAQEEMEILHRVMMDKIGTGSATLTESFRFGLIDSIMEIGPASQQAFNMAKDSFNILGNGLSDGITAMLDGTKSLKEGFRDMTVSILKDLSAMIIRQLIFNALSQATGSFLNLGQGQASAKLVVPNVPVVSYATGRSQRGGGGSTQDISRGLRPGQRPAILEDNELVLRPQDLDRLGGGGGSMTSIQVNTVVNVENGQAKSETEGAPGGEEVSDTINGAVVGVINEMLATPGSPLYQG